jgi:hypothetical protein
MFQHIEASHQSSSSFTESLNFSPPSSNRGGKPDTETSVGVDWLAYTMPGELFSECWEIVSRYYPLELSVKNPTACRGYKEVTEFQDGPKVSYSSDRPEIHIQFSGRVIGMLLLGSQIAMIRDFQTLGANCTRIDLRFDDYRQIVTPAHMLDWAKQGYLCRFRRWEPRESFSGTQSLGLTFTAGRRGQNGSGLYFRCYEFYFDKHGTKKNGKDSEGLTDAIRFECEFTEHKARTVCGSLAGNDSLQNSDETIRQFILGSIDFRSGSSERSYRDRSRVSVWDSYVQGVFPCKFVRPKRVDTQDFPVAAFARQWGGKLAAFLQSGGFDSFSKALSYSIADGVSRGYGVALPAEKIVVLKKNMIKMFPNLEHSRRYFALLAQANLGA